MVKIDISSKIKEKKDLLEGYDKVKKKKLGIVHSIKKKKYQTISNQVIVNGGPFNVFISIYNTIRLYILYEIKTINWIFHLFFFLYFISNFK
jgi:hypothetical protein